MSQAVKPVFLPKSMVHWILVAVLTVLVAIAALPNYLQGQWPWNADLQIPQIGQLRTLLEEPIVLPGWDMSYHQVVEISGKRWNFAEYQASNAVTSVPADTTIGLLLRAPVAHDQQPTVEWVDVRGSQGWKVSDLHRVSFAAQDNMGQPMQVTTRYFRGLNEMSTFAVMQWYAWAGGGHFAPGRWFWADQKYQWQQRERMPWVAVSLLLPIEPVGNIRPHTEAAVGIAQAVQDALMASTLQVD
ncbi:cyanoexosortase B system-associated protein [Oscillatoria sp. CS-180]|uniref:cyanoexosortase B system-associated protein n=1 Tax=Oscillatoria sp. CS-180 TaxID=3021720 RepID=UPI00232FBDEA|nr:cyanoexosortase B system-associated protein [Oscillatoria sp. CS-180]MDB9528031.1 cyanoexosortase B system-associated protein [Oscillatoria sp. CS-180]